MRVFRWDEISRPASQQTPTYLMKRARFEGVKLETSLRKLKISKDVCIRYELFMGDMGGGPIIDGPIGPKDLSTSFIFVFLDFPPSYLSTC